MYKIDWDTGAISYVMAHGVVSYDRYRSATKVCCITPSQRRWMLKVASVVGSIDKVLEPERKMVYLAFGTELRNVGAIR